MKSFKTLICALLALSMIAALGCAPAAPAAPAPAEPAPAAPAPAEPAPAEPAPAAPESAPYIAVVSKGFQHQFWQTVKLGSDDAAKKYGVEVTFDGPPSESDINVQVDMISAALAKNPVALALAALDTESVTAQLNDAKAKGIPVIGFDSGVPNAPAGIIYATAATDNEAAGALAADEMFKSEVFAAKLAAATAANPVIVACQSQDATSASVVGRTVGFVNQMKKLCEGKFPGAVEVTGHDKYAVAAADKAAVNIFVIVPPSTSPADSMSASQSVLSKQGLIGFFGSNEASIGGILAATTDGSDLDRTNGKYKDLIVIGFDAGKTQKSAVKNGWVYGSITQDPYMIGYLAVELAYQAYKGETVADKDTGCKFYNAANMDQPDIAQLLYD